MESIINQRPTQLEVVIPITFSVATQKRRSCIFVNTKDDEECYMIHTFICLKKKKLFVEK